MYKDHANDVGIDHSLEKSIRILFSYSLLKRGSSEDSFSIHPLVHSWASLRLKSEPQKEIEKAREAFGIIASGLRKSDGRSTADWVFEQQVMPHINAVMKYIPSQLLALGTTKIGGEACTEVQNKSPFPFPSGNPAYACICSDVPA